VVKQLGLPCEERAIHKDEFSKLSELFITSMGNDAVPVVALDGKKIGSGKPGPVAGKIYAELARRFYGLAAA
jgi:D-alanine transaminase